MYPLLMKEMLGIAVSNSSNRNEVFLLYTEEQNGVEPDGRAGIIRITQDGKSLEDGIIGSSPILIGTMPMG